MADTREEQLADIVYQASQLKPSERSKFVTEACEGDEELEAEAAEVLSGLGEVLSCLDRPGLADRSLTMFVPTPSRAATSVLQRLLDRHSREPRYRIEGELARGGMSVILRAWDRDMRRGIAMKVLRDRDPESSGTSQQDASTLGRFLEEAQVTGQLQHPGIVPVHELGIDSNGKVYFTMQLVKGSSFREVIDWARAGVDDWSETRALSVLQDVCEAVAYAHSKGVIHRDLKPQNVMVGRFGETYVMDWGVAHIVGQDERHDLRIRRPATDATWIESDRQDESAENADSPLYTVDGQVVGTPAYMPPEQALGQVELIDARADVYAIGAMLYHLLTGEMPYVSRGAQMSPRTILALVIQGPPKSLHKLNRNVSPELAAICDKAMARKPDDRYADTRELGSELRAYLEHRVVRAYRTGALTEARKWVVRNKATAVALIGGALLTLIVIAGAALITQQKNDALADQALELKRSAVQASDSADEARALADRRLQEKTRLADLAALEGLQAREQSLWPARPAVVPAMEGWLREVDAVLNRSAVHVAALELLRARAPEFDEAQFADELRLSPEFDELRNLQGRRDRGRAWLAARQTADGSSQALANQVAQLAASIDQIIADARAARRWRYPDRDDQVQYDQLVELVGRTQRLLLAPGPDNLVDRVRARLERAQTIAARTIVDFEPEWDEAINEIFLSDRYGGLEIEPQLGLVPIGCDPDSGLWEFVHVESGSTPVRNGDDDRLIADPESGVILVLIPGGPARIGSQPDDRDGVHYDPAALVGEPVTEVVLDPYFIAKYELTQSQWFRMTGERPSNERPAPSVMGVAPRADWRTLPVEQVHWLESRAVLARYGLVLPTEAQWEVAARAGTTTPWSCGSQVAALSRWANLADQQRALSLLGVGGEAWSDGFLGVAPVGSFEANAFGLHDLHGNVQEWCRDAIGPYANGLLLGDGYRLDAGPDRVARGGSFEDRATLARSSSRLSSRETVRSPRLGLRAAKRLDTGD